MTRLNKLRGRNELACDLSARRVRLDTVILVNRKTEVAQGGVNKVTARARGEDVESSSGDSRGVRGDRIERDGETT